MFNIYIINRYLDVNAGDPILIPPGVMADLSPGTVFLLATNKPRQRVNR
jgi:hypothetical protein